MRFDEYLLVRKYQDAFMLMKNAFFSDEKRLWIQFLVHFLNNNWTTFTAENIVQELLNEMAKVQTSKVNMYMALIINLIRRDGQLMRIFLQPFSAQQQQAMILVSNIRDVVFKWLPILFQVAPYFSEEFVRFMMRVSSTKFLLIYEHVMLTKTYKSDFRADELTRGLHNERIPLRLMLQRQRMLMKIVSPLLLKMKKKTGLMRKGLILVGSLELLSPLFSWLCYAFSSGSL